MRCDYYLLPEAATLNSGHEPMQGGESEMSLGFFNQNHLSVGRLSTDCQKNLKGVLLTTSNELERNVIYMC